MVRTGSADIVVDPLSSTHTWTNGNTTTIEDKHDLPMRAIGNNPRYPDDLGNAEGRRLSGRLPITRVGSVATAGPRPWDGVTPARAFGEDRHWLRAQPHAFARTHNDPRTWLRRPGVVVYVKEWSMAESNRRPPGCDPGALPSELMPHATSKISASCRRCHSVEPHRRSGAHRRIRPSVTIR